MAYLSRAKQLDSLCIDFVKREADLSSFVKAVIDNKNLKILSIYYHVIRETDYAILPDLISKTRSIHDLEITAMDQRMDDFYLALENLEKNESIVKLHISAILFTEIDYERITALIAKNRTVNFVRLSWDVYNDYHQIELEDDIELRDVKDSIDRTFEMCSNLDSLIVGFYERARYRGDELDLKNIIKISRTLAGSKISRYSRFPRELFNIILYEGFRHLNWFDDQLSVVIRALLNRRTIGIVCNYLLPLSRPYLYVRCRDALEKIA